MPSPGEDVESWFHVIVHHGLNDLRQRALSWTTHEVEIRIIEAALIDTSYTAESPDVPPQGLEEFQDLCADLHSIFSKECGRPFGYMRDDLSKDRLEFYWPKNRFIDDTPFSVCSLADVLNRSTLFGVEWTSADTRRLAVPLASGVLRLHDTPWLGKISSHQKIRIISQNGRFLEEHPLVSSDLVQSKKSVVTTPQTPEAAVIIRNEALFAFGLVLIELCMGRPMDKLCSPCELDAGGKQHDLSTYLAACRLLHSEVISDRFGRRWSDVVRRCIYCNFDQSSADLEDPDFREAVYKGVVVELAEEHRHFFKQSDQQ